MSKSISNKSFAIEHEDAIDFHLRVAWLDVSRMYNEIALQHGLSMSMAFILINISKKGSNPTKLGPQMGMQANSLSRTLKSLEDKGLIERRRDEGDKREVLIFLTELGVEARKASNAIIADLNEHIYNRLTESQRQAFVEVIQQVRKSVAELRKEMGIE